MHAKTTKLSATKISTFEQCPKYYEFQYILFSQRSFTPVEWEVGSIVHKAIAQLFTQIMSHHRSVIPKVGNADWYKLIVERLFSEMQMSVKEGVVRIVRPDKSLDYYYSQINSALHCFTTKALPMLITQKVREIEQDLGRYSLAGVELSGRIDLVTEQGANLFVHDWKTGKRREQDKRQARIYYFGCLAKFNSPIITYRLYHLLEAGEIVETYTFPPETKLEMEREIRLIVEKIDSTESHQPCPSMLCHWCPYGPQCAEGKAFQGEHAIPVHEDLIDLGIV